MFLISLSCLTFSSLRLCFVSFARVCMSVWLCVCFVLWFYSLLKAPPFPKYIFIIHQKPIFPIFPAFARVHFQLLLFSPVLLREVNPTVETDPISFVWLWFVLIFFSVCLFWWKCIFRQKQTIFNWLILLVLFTWLENPTCFDWCVEIIRKKGSLKNWLKNFDTCLFYPFPIADQIKGK